MSAATEFPPVIAIPAATRAIASSPAVAKRDATVLAFRARPPAVLSHRRPTAVPPRLRIATAPVRAAGGSGERPALCTWGLLDPGAVLDARALAGAFDAVPDAPASRLTRRGLTVLAVLTGVLAAVLLWIAHLSVPASGGASPASGAVTVHTGDTLWTIAAAVAPQRDPRQVVAQLERVNHLTDPLLTPGQQLRTG